MTSFKKVYELLIEGLFEIPNFVFEDIKDYIRDVYIKNVNINTKKFGENKIFNLDFKGTKYDFLNDYKPKIKIHFYKNRSDNINAHYNTFDEKVGKNTFPEYSNIYVNLSSDLNIFFDTAIEHELLHFVQDLIKEYRSKKGGGLIPQKYKYKPKEKDIIRDIDPEGYPIVFNGDGRKKTVKNRRVMHVKRPIEAQTNLSTAFRLLQSNYADYLYGSSKEDTTKERKSFLKFVLSDVKKNKINDKLLFKLRQVRKYTPMTYRYYLKILYKAFVNNESELDFKFFEDNLKSIDMVKQSKDDKNNFEDYFNGKIIDISYYRMYDFSELDDENFIFVDRLFDDLPKTIGKTEVAYNDEKDDSLFLKTRELPNFFIFLRNKRNEQKNMELKKNLDFFTKEIAVYIKDRIKTTKNLDREKYFKEMVNKNYGIDVF